jgi:SAM-dependent methyltransferase
MFSLTTENTAVAAALARRMREFYEAIADYDAYAESSQQPVFWAPIKRELEQRAARGLPSRVLEFGAGRTGFPAYLGPLRAKVEFHVQDITERNREDLAQKADKLWFEPLERLEGAYDVVFSTFVWEHLSRPRASLHALLRLLAPGGTLYLASPRYDLPGYVPPSARHLTRARQLALASWLSARRLRVALGGAPDFLLHAAPACLSVPWFRDADAIHWVSRFDLRLLEPEYRIEDIDVPVSGLKQWVWAKFALLFVRIRRREAAGALGSHPDA